MSDQKMKKECCVVQKKVAKLSTYMVSAVLWAVFQIEHATNAPHSLGMFTFRHSFPAVEIQVYLCIYLTLCEYHP